MAHVIKLKYGASVSWTYVDLTDSNHGNVDYRPSTPDEEAEDITESGTWHVVGSSVTDLIAKIGEIELAFHKAKVYNQDEIGAFQTYVTIQPDGVAATWQSQIFEGRLELTEDVFGADWANKATDVILYWRRAAWWEQSVAVPAVNSNTNKIFNGGDGSGSVPNVHENWLSVLAADVPGDMPAPATIVFTPASTMNEFVVISNARNVAITEVISEGETGTSDSTDANRSGGKFHDYTTPAGGTTGVDVSKAITSGGLSGITQGAWLRYFISAKFTGTVYARPYFEIGTKRYYGPRSVLIGAGANFYAYDLGMLRLPAGNISDYAGFADGLAGLTVGVNLIAATAIAVSVDYIMHIPVDSYAKGVLDTATDKLVILDTRTGTITGNSAYGATNKITSIGTLYGGLYLEPNMAQRLIFKITTSGLDTMANNATVALYAWLRKRTI